MVSALAGALLAVAVVGIGYLALRDTSDPEPGPGNGGGSSRQVRPAPVRPAPKLAAPPSKPERRPAQIPYGSLTLELEPGDARVTLPDVEPRYRRGVRLPEGDHRVIVRRQGYRRATRTITISGDTRVRIALEKTAPTAGESRIFDGIEFVWIPAGEFRMGSTSRHSDADEKPATRVRITRGFWMGKYEVTHSQWESVMGSNPSYFKNCGENCPVERISWDDVQVFVGRLNDRAGGKGYQASDGGGVGVCGAGGDDDGHLRGKSDGIDRQ